MNLLLTELQNKHKILILSLTIWQYKCFFKLLEFEHHRKFLHLCHWLPKPTDSIWFSFNQSGWFIFLFRNWEKSTKIEEYKEISQADAIQEWSSFSTPVSLYVINVSLFPTTIEKLSQRQEIDTSKSTQKSRCGVLSEICIFCMSVLRPSVSFILSVQGISNVNSVSYFMALDSVFGC